MRTNLLGQLDELGQLVVDLVRQRELSAGKVLHELRVGRRPQDVVAVGVLDLQGERQPPVPVDVGALLVALEDARVAAPALRRAPPRARAHDVRKVDAGARPEVVHDGAQLEALVVGGLV